MRIPIATGASAGATGPARPPALARLGPDGELVLIELQGALEMDGGDVRGGETMGVLHFPPGREEHPVLQISHHRLEGTFVTLRRPWAVLEKRTAPARAASPASPRPGHVDDDDDDDDGLSPPASPTLSRKRPRNAVDVPVTPPRGAHVRSSSPMPPPPPHWSDGAYDFSSPSRPAPDAARLPTTTSYAVVTIVRRKILFAKRPEPIVRLGA